MHHHFSIRQWLAEKFPAFAQGIEKAPSPTPAYFLALRKLVDLRVSLDRGDLSICVVNRSTVELQDLKLSVAVDGSAAEEVDLHLGTNIAQAERITEVFSSPLRAAFDTDSEAPTFSIRFVDPQGWGHEFVYENVALLRSDCPSAL